MLFCEVMAGQNGQNKRCLQCLGTNISKGIMPRKLQFIEVIGWYIDNTHLMFSMISYVGVGRHDASKMPFLTKF